MNVPLLLQGAYRLVLRLYPQDFRAAVGSSMLADLREGWVLMRRQRGIGGALRFGLRQISDLVGNLGDEWRAPSGPRVPAGRQGAAAWLRSVAQDLLFAVRSVRRDPAFALTVVLVVGVAITGVVSAWGMLEAILLEPLPYPGAERMVSLAESYRVDESKSVAYPNYVDWRDRNRVFEQLEARNWSTFNLTGEGPASSVWGQGTTPDLMSLFGVEPVRGRMFTEAELEETARVAVVSEGLWRERLGGDADVIGRDLRLDGEVYTIVGVLPALDEFPHTGAELWVPISITVGPNSMVDRTNHPGIEAFGKLLPGIGLEQAQADLDRVAAELASEYPESNAEAGVLMGDLKARVVGDADTTLWILLAAVTIVLLGVCANVASLMLARAMRRGGEIAVRAALGAGRVRLGRQLLAEGAVLSLLAGVVGLGGASVVLGFVRVADGLDLPRLSTLDVDGSVAAVAVGASLLAGLLFAAAPALRMIRTEPATALRGGESSRGATFSGRTGRAALVVVQVALAVVLLAGAGLMFRTLDNLTRADLGLDPGNVITAYLGPPQSQYPTNDDRARLYREVADRVAALPGVVRVAGGDPLPMAGRNNQSTVSGDGFPQIDEMGLRVDVARIMPGYFDIMGVDLIAGRDFREDDREPVVVIDETLAEFLWPDGGALGQRLRFRGPAEDRPWHRVVGVVEHVRNYGVRNESRYELYFPYTISAWGISLVVEAEPGLAAATVVEGIRRELHEVDPQLPLTRVSTMRTYIDGSIADEALVTRTLTGFALAALLVAVIGLYGVIAYSVTLRKREFGIRMALGAGRRAVLAKVILEGAWLAGLGVAIGIAGAIASGRVLSSLLYGVSTSDTTTLLAVAFTMAGVAVLASLLPARQAVKVDPAVALRD